MLRKLTIACACALTLSAAAEAEQFSVPAGNWQTTVTSTNSFMPTPITRTRTECRKETSFDPAKMMDGEEECTLDKQDISGNVLTFEMTCRTDGGVMKGKGRYELNGDQMKGTMDMQMNMGAQSMSMHMEFNGKRLGDC